MSKIIGKKLLDAFLMFLLSFIWRHWVIGASYMFCVDWVVLVYIGHTWI